MSGHTPGPWVAVGTSVKRADGPLRGKHIASTKFSASLVAPEVLEANARLIAAAPAMLAALEELLHLSTVTGIKTRMHRICRDAIALVRGAQSPTAAFRAAVGRGEEPKP